MGRVGKFGFKRNTRRRVGSKEKGSDESDEDYKVAADEEFDESDEFCSFDGDESEESLGDFEEEEEVEEEEEEEEEMKVKKVARSKFRRSFSGRKENGVMIPREKKRVSYKQEDDDDYNDDDEEFMPDEIDCVDDEDEFPVMKKNKKVGRPRVQEKGFSKGQKRKRISRVLKKPMTKKPRTSHRLVRKTSSGKDGEFTDKNLVVEEKSKKICGERRKRRYMEDSDSDFVISGSSEHEYTISEEEREQVREASKICTSLTTSLRSSSSSKRLQEEEEEEERYHQIKRRGRKGKEKVEDLKNEIGKQVCGICLSEEGKKTVRGTLNCCDHYFCFACIMEWSKVESRCPLCKQRFLTIGKRARSDSGFDLRTMVIHVPERDQVYQPSEEELRGYLDPYESVICTECHQGGDDALMLLCDICDSPAHTYCVGLGREVPEGNWYCEGCRPTAFGSSLNPQDLSPMPDQRGSNNYSGVSPTAYNVLQGIDLNSVYVHDTPLTQETEGFSSSRRTVSERRWIRNHMQDLQINRTSDSFGRSNGISATNSGIRLFGAHLEPVREIASQHIITPESMVSHYTFPEGRLQDNSMPLVRNRVHHSARLSHLSGRGMLRAELASTSPYACREATAPSRTSQGDIHAPF